MMPLPNDETTPPVTKMYLVSTHLFGIIDIKPYNSVAFLPCPAQCTSFRSTPSYSRHSDFFESLESHRNHHSLRLQRYTFSPKSAIPATKAFYCTYSKCPFLNLVDSISRHLSHSFFSKFRDVCLYNLPFARKISNSTHIFYFLHILASHRCSISLLNIKCWI